MTVTRLDKLLKPGPGGRLEKIIQRAQDMQDLTGRLRAVLDDELADALLAANVRDGELVLVCTSSAWASRLRFESEALLAAARAAGVEATRCQVRVAR
ncbi:MAG: DciA family protein [Woeseiaceae bacterium]|nr:DciA family protein [Woeseiaceae bacterium]